MFLLYLAATETIGTVTSVMIEIATAIGVIIESTRKDLIAMIIVNEIVIVDAVSKIDFVVIQCNIYCPMQYIVIISVSLYFLRSN